MKKILILNLALLFSLLQISVSCKKAEAAPKQNLTPQSAEEITIDSVTNHHQDTVYQYEYRTGESGNYQYNYDITGYDSDGNEVTGKINVEGKYGKGTLINNEGNAIEITAEWTGHGKLKATDDEGNEYELVVE